MGRDTYCFICGAPFSNQGSYYKDNNILKNILIKYLGKTKGMKYFNEIMYSYLGDANAKSIIDISYKGESWLENFLNSDKKDKNNYKLSKDELNQLNDNIIYLSDIKKYDWLTKYVFLDISGKNYIENIKDVDDLILMSNNGEFIDHIYKDEKIYISTKIRKGSDSQGIYIHEDCYKLASKKYGDFTFKDLQSGTINHKLLKNYFTQYYSFMTYFYDNMNYILESPLKNKKNKERILKLNLPINKNKSNNSNKSNKSNKCIKSDLKKYKDRKSPPYPANNCKNEIKVGNDGNKWISKPNKNNIYRWKEYTNQKGGNISNYYLKYLNIRKQ